MPTGYTSDVVDGKITDLRSFALQCARGMGALITMRDEPWDAPIPEKFEPSDYNAKRLAECQAERDRLYAISEAEADELARAEYDADLKAESEYLEKKALERSRYEAMIALVEPWEGAPEGLKEFMLEQLHRGMEFDCPPGPAYYRTPTLATGRAWKSDRLNKLASQIQHHAAENAKEQARTEGRNAWVAQLRVALNKATQP